MTTTKLKAADFAPAAFTAAGASATVLLNSSYDVARELFAALNPGYIAQWDKAHPDDKLTIRQSHAGSSILADRGVSFPKNGRRGLQTTAPLLFHNGLSREKRQPQGRARLVGSWQKRRLSRTVVSGNHVHARLKFGFKTFKSPEISRLKVLDVHRNCVRMH